jgi:hypothetical protein
LVFNGSEALVVTGRDTDATGAKAEDATGAVDWIWLRKALALVVAALGSEALAKRRLREWLASAKVPWDCKEWEGPDATLKQEREKKNIFSPVPPPASTGFFLSDLPEVPYRPGGPEFWSPACEIDWSDNAARDPATGARAWGITVSRVQLLALLSQPTDADVPAAKQSTSAQYAFDTAKRLKAEGRIWFSGGEWWVREDVEKDAEDVWRLVAIKKKAMKANVARLIAWEMDQAAEGGDARRPLQASSLENVLVEWGIWPLDSIK